MSCAVVVVGATNLALLVPCSCCGALCCSAHTVGTWVFLEKQLNLLFLTCHKVMQHAFFLETLGCNDIATHLLPAQCQES